MNTPSPLQPLGRAPSSGHSSWNLAIVIIVTLHVVFFAGLLQQGCRRPTSETAGTTNLGLTPTQPTNAASDAFAGYAPPYTPPATTPEPTNLDAYTPPAAVDTNFPGGDHSSHQLLGQRHLPAHQPRHHPGAGAGAGPDHLHRAQDRGG